MPRPYPRCDVTIVHSINGHILKNKIFSYSKIILPLLLLIVVGGVFAATRPVDDPFDGDAVVDPPFQSISYSIQTFLWWDEGYGGTQLDWVVQILGFDHVKQTFAWSSIELAKGDWEFTVTDRIVSEVENRDMQLIARMGQVPAWAADGDVDENANMEQHDTPPRSLDEWAGYCSKVAERYTGRIAAYQIWNEPNLSREWGDQEPDAVGYVELLAVCSEAIRAADPEAIIISAGLAPTGTHNEAAHRDDIFLDAMYRAGFQEYVDVVGVHAPGFSPPEYGPDDAERDGQGRWATFRRVEDLRKIMLMHDDAARQMAILEMGWTTDQQNPEYAWYAVSQEDQARYIVEAYAYAAEHWRPWVGLMSLIYMPKPGWTEADEEWWWTITTMDRGHRPAFNAISGMPRYCGDTVVEGWPEGVMEEVYLEQRITCP